MPVEREKPTVHVDTGDLPEQADQVWNALVEWGCGGDDPKIAARGNVLSMMDEVDGLKPYNRVSLKRAMGRAASFTRTRKNGVEDPVYVPNDVVDDVLDRPLNEYHGVRIVESVTDVPVLDRDGKMIYEPGLTDSRVWYRPAPALEDVQEHIKDYHSLSGLSDARDVITDNLLGDFDFVDAASRANAVALVLLPFVRPFIGDNPTPLHAVIAPEPGAGKTYLVQACLIPGCGRVGLASEPRNDEELRKLITSTLLGGKPSLVFDNLSLEVNSATWASALTTPTWQDRVLGRSEEVTLSNRLVWASTGNNPEFSAEMQDRICLIELQPEGGVPARHRDLRSFRHPDLHGWAFTYRARIAGAALTLILHWLEGVVDLDYVGPEGQLFRRAWTLDEGEPVPMYQTPRSMGSFTQWSNVLGGILEACGIEGFLDNRDRLTSADLDELETSAFMRAVSSWSGGEEFTVRALESQCVIGGPLHELVPGAVNQRNLKRGLTIWLRARKNSTHGGLTVRMRNNTAGGLAVWWMQTR